MTTFDSLGARFSVRMIIGKVFFKNCLNSENNISF